MIRKKCNVVVGFKAESGLSRAELEARARARMDAYGLSAMVANDIDDVGLKTSSAVLVMPDGSKDISGTKESVSDEILDYCVGLL